MHPVEIATVAMGPVALLIASTVEYLHRRQLRREQEQLQTANAFRAHWRLPLLSSLPGRPKRSPHWSASRSGRGSPRTAMRAARGLSARPGVSRAGLPRSSGTSSTTQTAMVSSRTGTSLVLGKSPLGSSTLLSSTRSRTPGVQQRSTSAAAPATGRTVDEVSA